MRISTKGAVSAVRVAMTVCGLAPMTAWAQSTIQEPQVIFSNFGPPDDRYSCCSIYVETGKDTKYGKQDGAIAIAFKFTVRTNNFKVSRVEAPISVLKQNGPGNKLLFVLAEDAQGLPGGALFKQQITVSQNVGCCLVKRIKVNTPVEILKGHAYWLEALPYPETAGGWAEVSIRSSGLQAVSGDGGKTWGGLLRDRAAAFAVYGVPVE